MDDLAQRLRRDHERLEELLGRLAEDARSSDPGALQQTWREFESCLTQHLQLEERWLLPRMLPSYPDEVRSTLSEHVGIRKEVAALGISVDLHLVKADAVDALIRRLRKHAESEDRTLYQRALLEAAASDGASFAPDAQKLR